MSRDAKPASPLLLKDLIRQVRREVAEAVREHIASGEESMFAVESLTLEVYFVVGSHEETKAGISAKLFAVAGLEAGGAHASSKEQTHKVTLQLSPVGPRGKPAVKPRGRNKLHLRGIDRHLLVAMAKPGGGRKLD